MKPRSSTWKIAAFTLAVLGTLAMVPRPKPLAAHSFPPADESDQRAGEVIAYRSNAKHSITQEVIAGRMPLTHAAALFGVLNRMTPRTDRYYLEDALSLPFRWPVLSDDERLCRQVASWVHHYLLDHSQAHLCEILTRLELEYSEERARTGHVQLPDPSSVEFNWSRDVGDAAR